MVGAAVQSARMTSERTETIAAPDGETFDGWTFLPDDGAGPGVLLLQEIFGVGSFLRAKAADLAALGHVVLCPDVFWRTERRVAHEHDDAGLAAAYASITRWNEEVEPAVTAGDLAAALAHLRALPEVGGRKVAVMGYCLGGRLAYELAASSDPDACVSYYGSGIGDRLAATAGSVTCPVLFHYGAADPFIPVEVADAVRAAFAGRDDVEVHVHDGAGHAFENADAPMFYDPDAAARSWAITTAWLADHLQP
jgi:carboxymethylenebutenolidase